MLSTEIKPFDGAKPNANLDPSDDQQELEPSDDQQELEPCDDVKEPDPFEEEQELNPSDNQQELEPCEEEQELEPCEEEQELDPCEEEQELDPCEEEQAKSQVLPSSTTSPGPEVTAQTGMYPITQPSAPDSKNLENTTVDDATATPYLVNNSAINHCSIQLTIFLALLLHL
jgi:hypothetical protein